MAAFNHSIQRGILTAKASKRAAFDAEQQARYDLYHGLYKPYLMRKIVEENPNTHKEFSPVYIDLVRMFVDRLAGGLYSDKWERTYSTKGGQAAEAVAKKATALHARYKIAAAMDKAARYCELHGTVAIHVVWRREQVELEVLPPMLWEVWQGEPDPTALADAEAWIVQQTAKVDTPVAEEVRDIVWTQHSYHETARNGVPQYFVTDAEGRIVEQDDNPYWVTLPTGARGWILPVEVLRREEPDREFYVAGGEDLVDAAMHVSYELSDIARTAKYQSHGQPVFTGGDPVANGRMVLSPSKAFSLEEGCTFDFKSVGAGLLSQRLEQLDAYLAKLAHSHSLPADTFNPDKAPESGIARRLANGPLAAVRAAYTERLADFEAALWRKVLVVHNRRSRPADALPEDLTLHVKPFLEAMPLDPLEQTQEDAAKIAMGVLTPVDVLMRDKGLSREDAAAVYADNLKTMELRERPPQRWEQTQEDEKRIALNVITAADIIARERGISLAEAETVYKNNVRLNNSAGAGGLRAALAQRQAPAGAPGGGQ